MIAFEITVNGKRACTAGALECGMLSAVLVWSNESSSDDVPTLLVRGFNELDQEHLAWLEREIRPGDTVCLRVVQADVVDEPTSRKRADPDFMAKAERRHYEELKRKFGDSEEPN